MGADRLGMIGTERGSQSESAQRAGSLESRTSSPVELSISLSIIL